MQAPAWGCILYLTGNCSKKRLWLLWAGPGAASVTTMYSSLTTKYNFSIFLSSGGGPPEFAHLPRDGEAGIGEAPGWVLGRQAAGSCKSWLWGSMW